MTVWQMVALFALLLGMGLQAWASLFRRTPEAPPPGSEGWGYKPPWRHADWYTPGGYRLSVFGHVLAIVSLVAVLVLQFLVRS